MSAPLPPELHQQLEALGGQLVWRIGKDEVSEHVVVRLGYASSTASFAHLPRLRSAGDAELQEAMSTGRLTIEWVDQVQLRAEQQFSLTHPQGKAAALQFVQSPALALAGVDFLQQLTLSGPPDGPTLGGELLVTVPMLGQVDLPFLSRIEALTTGAALYPLPLENERAWVEVAGQARVDGPHMHFAFQFCAHLATPPADDWGSAAFEKMAQATATRTLNRLAAALPAGIERSLRLT